MLKNKKSFLFLIKLEWIHTPNPLNPEVSQLGDFEAALHERHKRKHLSSINIFIFHNRSNRRNTATNALKLYFNQTLGLKGLLKKLNGVLPEVLNVSFSL